MNTLITNMKTLCEDMRMLSGICVAYGTQTQSESVHYGRAQEVLLESDRFIPWERPLESDSIYDLASLTKLFTAVAAMILVEQGKLSLFETVSEIDPRFVNLKGVSVFDVLSFRVSLRTPGRLDETDSREESLRRLFAVEICDTPAVRVYSDINAMVIKYVIEAKCGLPLFDAVNRFILMPAGMSETFAVVPEDKKARCVCYNYEHRIANGQYILRTDTPLGAPHDPKSLALSMDGRDLCGHAGLFSTQADMIKLCQMLLGGELLSKKALLQIAQNYTGKPNGDGTYRQYLGFLCFTKHPYQRLSEVPEWMSETSIGLSGFTGNHLSLDPLRGRFVLFLGNRCHARVSNIALREGETLADFGLKESGVGQVRWPDNRLVSSSVHYVYFKDEMLHAPIAQRMREVGWL